MPHSASTRQQILKTALALFSTQGYDATSLREIADQLNLTKAALYYHFPAKEHLVLELTRPWLEAISQLIETHRPDTAVEENDRRRRLVEAYVDIVLEHHAVLRFLTADPAAQKHPDVGKRGLALVLALQDALRGPVDDDVERIRVSCAVGAIHATAIMDEPALAIARPIVIAVALEALGVEPARSAAK